MNGKTEIVKTRNEAQRIFDALTIDVWTKIVFNASEWAVIVKDYPGRLGRELLRTAQDHIKPVDFAVKDGVLAVARFYLLEGDPDVRPSNTISQRYITAIQEIIGLDLKYLDPELAEIRDKNEDIQNAIRTKQQEGLIRVLRVLLDAIAGRENLDWESLRDKIPETVDDIARDLGHKKEEIFKSSTATITIPPDKGMTGFEKRLQRRMSFNIEKKLWTAVLREYETSHLQGNRFEGFDRIRKELLPKGYIQEVRFTARGRMHNGKVDTLEDICRQGGIHIAVVGEGGIGKTTFLQQYMKEAYYQTSGEPEEYDEDHEIPVFIELSRCTEKILEWKRDGHTTFIARYLCALLENHGSLEDVSDTLIKEVDHLFQKAPADHKRKIVLLLDGFNEVPIDKDYAIRQALSDEIRYLQTCSNVRIITTSRETQAASYAARFEQVQLIGLEEDDIRSFLVGAGFADNKIDSIFARKTLIDCLRVPLYLCMYAARGKELTIIPENAGEILYFFFHKESPFFHSFYNVRKRADEINQLDARTIVVLDYILPFIGWQMEQNGTMSIDVSQLQEMISQAVTATRGLFGKYELIENEDFEYSGDVLSNAIGDLYVGGCLQVEWIINCLHGILGIMYRYVDRQERSASRYRYSFIHHHIRDYFSAIWLVQLLKMVGEFVETAGDFMYMEEAENEKALSYQKCLNTDYWIRERRILIGQILMEHRNRTTYNKERGIWEYPPRPYPEQRVMENVVRFCAVLRENEISSDILLDNALGTVILERGEIVGMDLSGLDLRNIQLFNICCSKRGASDNSYLTTDFRYSQISDRTFSGNSHEEEPSDFLYRHNRCFTSDKKTLICHDLITGKAIFSTEIERQDHKSFLERGYRSSPVMIWASNDGEWCCYNYNHYGKEKQGCVTMFHVGTGLKRKLFPDISCQAVTLVSFTEDSRHVIVVYDTQILCVFELSTGKKVLQIRYSEKRREWASRSLYCAGFHDTVFILDEGSEKYAAEDTEDPAIDAGDEAENTYHHQMQYNRCRVLRLSDDLMNEEELFSFACAKFTSLVFRYLPFLNAFLYYDSQARCFYTYDIRNRTVVMALPSLSGEMIPPMYVSLLSETNMECMVYYEDRCCRVSMDPHARNDIVEVYEASEAVRLAHEINMKEGLHFDEASYHMSPYLHLTDELNSYEWDLFSGTVHMKYMAVHSHILDMKIDREHHTEVLLHGNNTLSVFNGTHFDRNICLGMQGYSIIEFDYHPGEQTAAILFLKPGHVVARLVHTDCDYDEEIFSSMLEGEINLFANGQISFSNDGKKIVIQLPLAIYEYSIAERRIRQLKFTGFDEDQVYLYARFDEEVLNIVTGFGIKNKPYIQAICTQYKYVPDGSGEDGYIKIRTYVVPCGKEWTECLLIDAGSKEFDIKDAVEEDILDEEIDPEWDEEETVDDWMDLATPQFSFGVLLPVVSADHKMYLYGFARNYNMKQIRQFCEKLNSRDLKPDEDIADLYPMKWEAAYWKERICVLFYDRMTDNSKLGLEYQYYDRKTGSCILTDDNRTVEMYLNNNILNREVFRGFLDRPINPNKPHSRHTKVRPAWQPRDIQPLDEGHNMYYFPDGEFGVISRYPDGWKYSIRRIYHSPGVCIKNCDFAFASFEGDETAVVRRAGGLM